MKLDFLKGYWVVRRGDLVRLSWFSRKVYSAGYDRVFPTIGDYYQFRDEHFKMVGLKRRGKQFRFNLEGNDQHTADA